MSGFLEMLRIQRWDDHRYYHHSRVNQSLHLLSATSFVIAYMMMFKDPALAALVGWLVSMTSRQIGHLVFEPKTYDVVNQATHEYKEEIKVGYNLRRKIVLMTIWALSPLLLLIDPTMLGLCEPPATPVAFARHLGYLWLVIGVAGLLFRTVQLFVIKDLQTGLVWATKILTDPFHDIKLYHRAPMALLRRNVLDHVVVDDYEAEAIEITR
jgi:L-lactate permease